MASPCHQNLLKKSDPGPRQTIADPGKTHQTVKKWTAERESKENEAQERIEEQMRDEQAKEKQERSDIKAKEKEERKNKRIADKEVRNLETSSTSLPRRKHSVALIILLQANTPKNMNSNQITEYKTTSRIKKGNSENGMNNAFWHKTVLPNGKLDVHFVWQIAKQAKRKKKAQLPAATQRHPAATHLPALQDQLAPGKRLQGPRGNR